MIRFFRKKPVIFLAVLMVVVDVCAVLLLTLFQTDFIDESPDKSTVISLFYEESGQGKVYYMNGAGDIDDEDSTLFDLLKSAHVTKTGKMESYRLLFSLGKNDFILQAKTVVPRDLNAGKYCSIRVYEKNNVVYIVQLQQQDLDSNSTEFSFYATTNEEFTNQILEYKADENNYYTYLPGWLNDIIRFNLHGKLMALFVVSEIAVLVLVKKRSKVNKKK